jgi:predicted aldo/keto reductase-like oxidoreductase
MQYRNDKQDQPISILGFGCMRFTKKGNSIDIDKAEKEVMAAINAGVNYLAPPISIREARSASERSCPAISAGTK